MAEFLALRIITGKLTLDQVPMVIKPQVEEILRNKGYTESEE